jgi:hypothetical protein
MEKRAVFSVGERKRCVLIETSFLYLLSRI